MARRRSRRRGRHQDRRTSGTGNTTSGRRRGRGSRRFVTNVRVAPIHGSDHVEARSYLLLYRSRGDDRPADLVSVERTDRLRPAPGGWVLVARDLVVDEAVLRTQNLALFL